MARYLALLRGVNVGGKGMIKMADLKTALEAAGFDTVKTYIQSGNILFSSDNTDNLKLADQITKHIRQSFDLTVEVVVFSQSEWRQIIAAAPSSWGADKTWKHNLLVLLPPYNMAEAVTAVGALKPDIEAMRAGDGVLYQSMSQALFGRTTTGKLASNPLYKRLTIRNYNTATKLLALLDSI